MWAEHRESTRGGFYLGRPTVLTGLGLGLSRDTGASENAWDSAGRLIPALQSEGTRRSPSCRSRDRGNGTGAVAEGSCLPMAA